MLRRSHAVILGFITWALLSAAPSTQTNAPAPQASGVTISGSVVDTALSPLAGVTVTLEHAGRTTATTTTDANGKFRFTNIAPGDYRVRAEHPGFPAFARDLKVPSGLMTIQLPIVLATSSDALPKSEAGRSSTIAGLPQSTVNVSIDGVNTAPPPPPAALMPPPPSAGAAGGRGAGGGGGRAGAVAAQGVIGALAGGARPGYPPYYPPYQPYQPYSTASYAHLPPNRFHQTTDEPLSTFGADVDTASYSNVRRFLSSGQLPPPDAVRVEEFVNYFRFGYAEPRGGRPIAFTTEVGDCPWTPSHKLVLIGARAKASTSRELEGRNIVLLIDVSGSMAPPERLPLIKSALGLFVDTLQPDDRIAIVTYAGTSGLALPSTPARYRDVIQRAIAGLSAGGSTNGGQGLMLAYRVASEAFIPGGVNRVILSTDGDFNVGITSGTDLLHLIQREKESGVFLSVFGVGTDNLKDSTMEMLADKGNGHYAYLDSLQEARRVLVREGDATLETVAKDVKFQVEFNPAMVTAWKQIGYEDRALAAPDFNNDRKDGGEMGAGHTVTVLYEVVPPGVPLPTDDRGYGSVDPLNYQPQAPATRPAPSDTVHSGEWLTVKVRYKAPDGETSDLLTQPVRSGGRLENLPFAAAVAEFGLLLRSDVRDTERWDALSTRLQRMEVPSSVSGDRDAFGELVSIARGLARLR